MKLSCLSMYRAINTRYVTAKKGIVCLISVPTIKLITRVAAAKLSLLEEAVFACIYYSNILLGIKCVN